MAISLLLLKLLFPPPSLFVMAMSVISFTSLAKTGYMETKGTNMQYSKFLNVGVSRKQEEKAVKLSTRTGMLVAYTPPFLVGVASLVVFADREHRFLLLMSVLTVHFFKRILEVLFVHKYSGSMALKTVIRIALSYTFSTTTMIYTQYLSGDFLEPSVDLKYFGIMFFFIGIVGNFYHHHILSSLRKEGDKEYKIPRGGLFDTVVCPHYLFEILGFIGVSCISQTIYVSAFTLGIIFYLMGRSYATKAWYILKFGDTFPKDVKALIPHVF